MREHIAQGEGDTSPLGHPQQVSSAHDPAVEKGIRTDQNSPSPAPRSLNVMKRDPDLALLYWFSQNFSVRYDASPNFRQAAASLLRTYGPEAKDACQRAHEMKATLCKEGQRFTISTVLFYSRFYDRSLDGQTYQSEAEVEAEAKKRETLHRAFTSSNLDTILDYIKAKHLTVQEVRKYEGDAWADSLFDGPELRDIDDIEKHPPFPKAGRV
jgi:hypothetical protein